MVPPIANDVIDVARQPWYGPVRPNGVSAQTTASSAAHASVCEEGSHPGNGSPGTGDTMTTSASRAQRLELVGAAVGTEVERHRPLAGAVVAEQQAVVALVGAIEERRHLAEPVAARRLDHDDLRTQIGEDPGAVGGDRSREVEHPHAREHTAVEVRLLMRP